MFPRLIGGGNFFLPTYGALVACGFLAALWVTLRLAARRGVNQDQVANLAVYVALAGLAGAKLTMFLFDWDYYSANPGELISFSTLKAAGVYQGGVALAFLAAFYFIRRYGLRFPSIADLFAPGLALGHAIGRLGCFAAGCCYGIECRRPWAVTFTHPDAYRISGTPLGVPLHPTQLYEFAAELAIFAFLYLRKPSPARPGRIMGWYLLLYSGARILVELLRHHDQPPPLGLPFSLTQWIALGMGSAGIWLLRRRSVPTGQTA